MFTGTPPLGFTYGLGGLLLFPLRAGASTLLIERATPAELADAIAAHGVTVLSTAPTAYRAMLAAGKAPALKNLRRCVSAGEHLPQVGLGGLPPGHRRWPSSTASARPRCCTSSSPPPTVTSGPARPARPSPATARRSWTSSGEEVPDGVPGRLAVQGPTGCRYLSDERQRTYVQHGWNITGDTYIRDADGYFWYQARSDDMIISAGYNIAGPEVEEALLGHPDVLEVAVIGAPDPGRGMVVQAYVVLREGAAADPAKVGRAAGLHQGLDRAVQVPQGDRVRLRAAQDHQREDPAIPAPADGGAKLQARSG